MPYTTPTVSLLGHLNYIMSENIHKSKLDHLWVRKLARPCVNKPAQWGQSCTETRFKLHASSHRFEILHLNADEEFSKVTLCISTAGQHRYGPTCSRHLQLLKVHGRHVDLLTLQQRNPPIKMKRIPLVSVDKRNDAVASRCCPSCSLPCWQRVQTKPFYFSGVEAPLSAVTPLRRLTPPSFAKRAYRWSVYFSTRRRPELRIPTILCASPGHPLRRNVCERRPRSASSSASFNDRCKKVELEKTA